jgi:hypothetical protein
MMKRNYLTWGLVLFALGALLTFALPDPVDTEDASRAAARGEAAGDTEGELDTTGEAYAADASENAADVLGWLAMLGGLGLALTGLFRDSAAEHELRRRV